MNYDEAKQLAEKLTPINCVKLSLRAAELSYPSYTYKDENDTVVIGAINATRTYLESPCKETAGAACTASDAAGELAEEAADFAVAYPNCSDAAPGNAAYSTTNSAYAASLITYGDRSLRLSATARAIACACDADETLALKIKIYAAELFLSELIAEQGDRKC